MADPAVNVRARPAEGEIDVFGCTHQGHVRRENQDQFLVASLHRTIAVHGTSLPPESLRNLTSESTGYVCLVADGVGGGPGGSVASSLAVRAIVEYVTHGLRFHYRHTDLEQAMLFLEELHRSVLRSHEIVRADGLASGLRGMATTLTMVVVIWPRAYLIHVGDSRCYRLRDGRLEQVSQDQTMERAMVDAGVLPADKAHQSPWRHVLASVVGGEEATPMTVATDVRRDDVMLLCTDGLTKHVSDDELAAALASRRPSAAIAQELLELALARGGTDNVTVVVGQMQLGNATPSGGLPVPA